MAKTLLNKLGMAASILATSAIISCIPANYDVGKGKAYREASKATQRASEGYDEGETVGVGKTQNATPTPKKTVIPFGEGTDTEEVTIIKEDNRDSYTPSFEEKRREEIKRGIEETRARYSKNINGLKGQLSDYNSSTSNQRTDSKNSKEQKRDKKNRDIEAIVLTVKLFGEMMEGREVSYENYVKIQDLSNKPIEYATREEYEARKKCGVESIEQETNSINDKGNKDNKPISTGEKIPFGQGTAREEAIIKNDNKDKSYTPSFEEERRREINRGMKVLHEKCSSDIEGLKRLLNYFLSSTPNQETDNTSKE